MNDYEWFEIYEARFGKKLPQHEVEIWDSEIHNQIKNCNAYEIVDAVRSLAEQKRQGKLRYQITVNNIISEIIKARFIERQPSEARELTSQHEEQLNKWRYQIRNAPNTMEKWEVICSPNDTKDCCTLEAFAESLEGGFKRPSFPSLADHCEKIESAWRV